MPKPKTNIAIITKLMNASAMNQLLIMDAVGRLAQAVADTPDDELVAQFNASGANTFINPLAWKAAAVDIVAEIKRP